MESMQLEEPLRKKQKPKRNKKDCPIKGCYSKNLVKLSQHLKQMHKIKSKIRRQKLIKKATKVRKFTST